MENPFISTVIPLYNKEGFIKRALDSALSQTYTNFEILVIDDGSTDKSAEIVRQVTDSRVRLIHQENQGASAARNRGIDLAEGKLVAFLDADDEWNTTYLETIVDLYHKYPAAGVYATAYIYFAKNKDKRTIRNRYMPQDQYNLIDNPFLCYSGEPLFFTSSAVSTRQILQEVGGFPVGIKLGEDIETWLKIGLAHSIAFTPQALVNYRRDTDINTCDTEIYHSEPHYMRLMQDLWQKGKIKKSLKADFLRFMSYQKITLAKIYLDRNETKKVRATLLSFFPRPRYLLKWLVLFFISLFPSIIKYIKR